MTGRTLNDSTVADRLAVSPAEAARLAGVGRTTIYEAIGSGALRSLKIGKRRLIMIVSIREWLETAQQAVASAAQRRAPAIRDAALGSEERVHVRASSAWAVSPRVDRSPCGDGG
jgi:excisionase family DNA binding protein